MAGPISRATAIFERPFSLPGFAEVLPAGEYDLETQISAPPDHRDPDRWKASVLVRLHARTSHPGLVRSLTVPLSALEDAMGRDKLTGASLVDFFVEEMLADPMVRLVMRADRVSEAEVRTLYARSGLPEPPAAGPDPIGPHSRPSPAAQDGAAVQAAENEGMPPRHPCGPVAMAGPAAPPGARRTPSSTTAPTAPAGGVRAGSRPGRPAVP